MARRLQAAPEPTPRKAPDLRVSVADAIAGMTWLKPSDEGIKALALRYAEEIEQATERAKLLEELLGEMPTELLKRLQKLEAMCDVTKTVGWLGPQLQGVLRDLGGTPAARKAMQENNPVGGRLKQLRDDAAS